MLQTDPTRSPKTLTMHEAFNRDELSWFAEFDSDQDLWNSLDTLFPDETRPH